MKIKNTKYLFLVLLMLGLVSCKDQWDEHFQTTDIAVKESIFDRLSANADLSAFTALVEKVGLKETLSGSVAYSIWAPDNSAIAALDAAVLTDTTRLKAFVLNHIAYGSYSLSGTSSSRIKALNGKYVNYSQTSFEEAAVTTANLYARNGFVHVVNKAIEAKSNIWEYLNNPSLSSIEKDSLLAFNYQYQDTSKAEYLGIDPQTGKPVYKANTGLVTRNLYSEKLAQIAEEEQQFTFFLLQDDVYRKEENKIRGFFNTGTSDSTRLLANWSVLKDLVVKGKYTLNNLPDTLTSVGGVRFAIDKSAITGSYTASNGIVYRLNKVEYKLENKFPALVVEGEKPAGFSRADKSSSIFYRYKADNAGKLFTDLMVYDTKVSDFWVQYQLQNVPSGKYKVYWRAVAGNQDSQTVPFQQKLAINSLTATNFAYKQVQLNDYSEVYLGDYEVKKYSGLTLYILANASTTAGLNTISVDYIKLKPVL